MNCKICGRENAHIRQGELKTAKITHRAHVDCKGHSQYRGVTTDEIETAIREQIAINLDATERTGE